MSPWRSYLLVMLALLPSTIWLIWLGAFYASVWMSVATLVMLIYAVWHYLGATQSLTSGYPCTERLTDDAKLSTFSKSLAQTKWHRFEDYQETKHDFQFWRLDRCTLIPKQTLSAEQLKDTRQFIARVRKTPAGDSAPLPGYADIMLADSPYQIHRYHYTADDMQQLLTSQFKPYSGQAFEIAIPKSKSQATQGRPPTWRTLLRITAVVAILIAVLVTALGPGRRVPNGIIEQLLICLIPFVILAICFRVAMAIRRSRKFKVPPDPIEMRLTNDGIAFGDADAIVLYHWLDVNAIFVSAQFVGLRTVNNLINVLPKRALGDDLAVQRFLELVLELKRNCVSDEPGAVRHTTSSTNPYQPPST